MATIKLSEFPVKQNGIRVMYDGDQRIDVEQLDYWMRDTEKEYNAVTNKLDKIQAKGKGYQIYVWYDVSGFDYWHNQMNEDNYAQITIQFDSDEINTRQIPSIMRKLEKIINKVNNVIFY